MAILPLSRSGFFTGALFIAPFLSIASALAVPSDQEAWRSDEHGIIVYKDAEPGSDTYWFIPKIRFEARDGKTVMRSKVLANGKTEFAVRIIPYFSKDLKELAAQNISNIRQDSQLKPVIAKTVGISLPDFGYKFASASVTNFQYLDAPRLLKFSLDAEEAATFNDLYQDELGVNVDLSIAYDGMMTDKFYNIEISCKDMSSTLDVGFSPSVSATGNLKGVKVFAGADLEAAFIQTISKSTKGVNIVSKGDLPDMQDMLRRVMNLCFDKVDGYSSTSYPSYPGTRYPSRTSSSPTPDPAYRYGNFVPYVSQNAFMTAAVIAATEMDSIQDTLLVEKPLEGEKPAGDGTGLLPEADLKMKFRYKKTSNQSDNQAVVKQVTLKDTTSVITIPGILSASQKEIEKVLVQSIADKKFTVNVKNTAATPLKTGIMVKSGEQWTMNAAFVFSARTTYSPFKARQYDWDSTWSKPDGDLYFRIGNGHWTPVNGRSIIESGVIGGGELEFYLDRSSIFNRIPEKLRKGGILYSPLFTIDAIAPEFSVQLSGRRIDVR